MIQDTSINIIVVLLILILAIQAYNLLNNGNGAKRSSSIASDENSRCENGKLEKTCRSILMEIQQLRDDVRRLTIVVENLKKEAVTLPAPIEVPILVKSSGTPVNDATNISLGTISEKAKEKSSEPPSAPKDMETVKYAPHPNYTADHSPFFHDLTEKKEEESIFELKICKDKALFTPLNFMKYRSFDAVMNVIDTSGVRPNVAHRFEIIEPGKAHCVDNKWYIDENVKIELK